MVTMYTFLKAVFKFKLTIITLIIRGKLIVHMFNYHSSLIVHETDEFNLCLVDDGKINQSAASPFCPPILVGLFHCSQY